MKTHKLTVMINSGPNSEMVPMTLCSADALDIQCTDEWEHVSCNQCIVYRDIAPRIIKAHTLMADKMRHYYMRFDDE